MRTIIAGTRTAPVDAVEEAWKFFNAREGCPRTTWIISGGAQGADEYGEMIARAESIAMRLFRADWKMHGRAAGPIRNEQMAKNADACLVVWDGKSRGSYSMIRLACMHGLDVVVWYYGEAAGRPPWMSKEQPEGSLPWTKEKYEDRERN